MLGTISDQNVSRISPGTMISAKPIAMPIPARMDAAITAGRNGTTADTVSPRFRSARPSRTSWTALTRAAWTRNAAITR